MESLIAEIDSNLKLDRKPILMDHFEKSWAKKSKSMNFSREPQEHWFLGCFYKSDETNTAFNAFMMGMAYVRSMATLS